MAIPWTWVQWAWNPYEKSPFDTVKDKYSIDPKEEKPEYKIDDSTKKYDPEKAIFQKK